MSKAVGVASKFLLYWYGSRMHGITGYIMIAVCVIKGKHFDAKFSFRMAGSLHCQGVWTPCPDAFPLSV